jgi:hypothetical protein
VRPHIQRRIGVCRTGEEAGREEAELGEWETLLQLY